MRQKATNNFNTLDHPLNHSRSYKRFRPSPPSITSIQGLIQLDRTKGIPLYKQIYQALREAILSGALAEGTRLPTERALARDLEINRTTVMNAYNELASEGLVEGHVGRGTIVKRSYYDSDEQVEEETPSWLFGLAANEEVQPGPDTLAVDEIISMSEKREIISFGPAAPSRDLFPAETLSELLIDGLANERQTLLDYCPVEGLQSLRRGIAARMRKQGIAIDLQNILILSGSTQGIGLISRMLLHAGDEVVVEIPTYLGALQTFRALGARVIGVPLDNDGMRIDLLESILARRSPRLIYTQPNFHNPTGIVMSPDRRRRLLLLARRYQVPIVEDDAYGDIYFEGKRPQPLKALDSRGHVLYISTFSKILAPGLRVAWLAAPGPMIDRLALHKQIFDLNTGAIGQWVVAEFLHRGLLDEHLTMLRQSYKKKRDHMLESISAYWPTDVRVNHPQGGFHLWCRLPAEVRARVLLREAAQKQVTFVIGEPFHIDGGGHQYIRLSYASPEEQYIEEGIQRIGEAIKSIQARRISQEERDNTHIERMPMV
jgi:DNA-binding transcriptional MocR family regulator